MARVNGNGGLAAFHQYNRQRQEHMYDQRRPRRGEDEYSPSPAEDIGSMCLECFRALWYFWNERGRALALKALVASARRLRQNLSPRRLFSFPHLLVAVWVVVLLWGERWVFQSKVEHCDWSSWEKWPSGATPHHLVLVADPQLIDPHSYPGRPWPLNPLTYLVTDNYLRRSYNQLQWQLQPDSTFFLGDLFDGGREWKTAHGDFKDPAWSHRPASEQKYAKRWNKKYGQDFWLREYVRFGDIFIKPWLQATQQVGASQTRRKLIASLPGNHDLGFGSEVKLPVRNRFETFFGDGNRMDVIGNHTIVSVDTVSLSAGTSEQREQGEVVKIYEPVHAFLDSAKMLKRKAVAKELRLLQGDEPEGRFTHIVEDVSNGDLKNRPSLDPGEGVSDLPTILLTHVPLYRPPGTPCGPLREHWPPAKPPKGQTGPVIPDDRNAITVAGGYQYQNVLSEQDSVLLVEKVGNVVHAFSGDDHDYCELKHGEKQEGVPEITVKSISMAMGVPTPGFLMVSLYNPIDGQGKPLASAGEPTLQTHLCLLPTQLSTYSKYAAFIFVTLVLLGVRAFLVPVLNLPRFALEATPGNDGPVLPVYKAKMEDYDEYSLPSHGISASRYGGGGSAMGTRDRSSSLTTSHTGVSPNGLAAQAINAPYAPKTSGGKKIYGHHHHAKGSGKWGWGVASRGPKIEIKADNAYYDGGKWKLANARLRPKSIISVALRELWTTVLRVAWMVVAFWVYLALKG